LADAGDPAHERAVHLRRQYSDHGVLVTTDYVLDETITRVFTRRPFGQASLFCDHMLRAIDAGLVVLESISRNRFDQAWKLGLRYRDKPRVSFTDLTSFVVMRELRIREVLTGDEHFNKVHLGFRVLP
jgi:predicted nucleic acid-binding protein